MSEENEMKGELPAAREWLRKQVETGEDSCPVKQKRIWPGNRLARTNENTTTQTRRLPAPSCYSMTISRNTRHTVTLGYDELRWIFPCRQREWEKIIRLSETQEWFADHHGFTIPFASEINAKRLYDFIQSSWPPDEIDDGEDFEG